MIPARVHRRPDQTAPAGLADPTSPAGPTDPADPTGPRGERGSIAPLALAFAAIAVGVALVIAGAASMYLERKQLMALADAAALSAVTSYDLGEVVVEGDSVRARLDPVRAADAVTTYVRAHGADCPGIDVVDVVVDGDRVVVHLRGQWQAPFGAGWIVPNVPIDVVVASRAVLE